MPALNSPRASWHVWAPPVGEVTTLSARNPSGWPAGTRLVVAASDADLLEDAVSLGAAVLSEGDTIASWPLDLDACAHLRAAAVFALQVPSGEAWEGVMAGAVLPEPLWRGQQPRTQALGTVTTGPQGPVGVGADPETIAAEVEAYLTANPPAGSLDAEAVQDIVGAMVTAAGGTYDDGAGTITLPSGGASSTITADDTPAAPAEGASASYLVTSAVSWPAGLVWSTDPDDGQEPTISGLALVTLFTLGGVCRAVLGATFPSPVAPDVTPPTAGTLSANSVTETGFTLLITGATDNDALALAAYAFDDGSGSFGPWQTTALLAVSGKVGGTSYTCRHKVRDASGNEATGSSITVTTATPADTTAPTAPTGLTATATGTTAVDLSWSASTDAVGVTGYEYRIDAGSAIDAGAGLAETVSGLTASTTYTFEVRAYDAAGNRSAWSATASATTDASADTTAPSWSATLTPGTPTTDSVVVTASALATDNVAVTGYEVTLDSTAGSPTWSAVVPSGLNFTLTGLSAGVEYASCALRAKDAAGNASTPLAIPTFTTDTAPAPGLSDAILALGPVGYWKLNETSGTTAVDSSGYGRDGTYAGTYTLAGQDGFVSLASGSEVTIPDHDDFTAWGSTNGFFVFALCRPAANPLVSQRIVAKKTAPDQNEWHIGISNTSPGTRAAWWMQTPTDSGWAGKYENTGKLTAGVWHALAGGLTSSSQGSGVLYVDSGVASAVTTVVGGTASYAGTASPVRIGGGATEPYAGGVGHVAIFRRALTATEVGDLVTLARAEGLIP